MEQNAKMYLRSVNEMVCALAVGVMSADLWFPGWTPPEGMPQVLNDFAAEMEKRADGLGFFKVQDSGKVIREFVHKHPTCIAWNRIGDPPDLVFTSRRDPPNTARSFIDLDAIAQNAAAYLRQEDRMLADVDRCVERNHPGWSVYPVEGE